MVESNNRHLFLTGEKGVGKTTLIQRLLSENKLLLHGFITKRLLIGDSGNYGVFFMPVAANSDNLGKMHQVAWIYQEEIIRIELEAFETFGVDLLSSCKDGLIVMDELGFLESGANKFCHQVLALLDGDVPVLGVLKPMKTPFLDQVRAHKNVSVIEVTEANRNLLYPKLLDFIQAWNEGNSF